MTIYRFLAFGIWKFHLTVILTAIIVATGLEYHHGATAVLRLFEVCAIAYFMWLVGLATAVRTDLHTYVRKE